MSLKFDLTLDKMPTASDSVITEAKAVFGRYFKFPAAFPLFFLYLLSPISSAQNDYELQFLVFEPVLISANIEDEQVEITELTSLPRSEKQVSVSEYVALNLLQEPDSNPVVNLEESVASYDKAVNDLQLQGGAYEPALSQEYMALGQLYQSMGDHETALEKFDQALHINRVTLGLFNLDQEAIVEEKIESYLATGDLQSADIQQEYLFNLKLKAYGPSSLELLPAMTKYAEWNIFAFDARLGINSIAEYTPDSPEYSAILDNSTFSEPEFRSTRLIYAQNIYYSIIQILINHYGISDPRLLEMEKNLALTNYFFATNFIDIDTMGFSTATPEFSTSSVLSQYEVSNISSNSRGFKRGKEALERRLEYMQNMDGVSPLEIANARIELADWLLIFKKRVSALEVYEEAYRELQAIDLDQEKLDEIFSPAFPESIPEFLMHNYSRIALNIPHDVALDYQGYFDVQFELNRFGLPRKIDILDKSSEASNKIEDRLTRYIRKSVFRPRFNDGQLRDSDIIQARYYYSY